MALRIRLTEDMVLGLANGKRLNLCFQIDSAEEEDNNGSRLTVDEAVIKGSVALSVASAGQSEDSEG